MADPTTTALNPSTYLSKMQRLQSSQLGQQFALAQQQAQYSLTNDKESAMLQEGDQLQTIAEQNQSAHNQLASKVAGQITG